MSTRKMTIGGRDLKCKEVKDKTSQETRTEDTTGLDQSTSSEHMFTSSSEATHSEDSDPEFRASPAKRRKPPGDRPVKNAEQEITINRSVIAAVMRTAVGMNISSHSATAITTKLITEGGGDTSQIPLSLTTSFRMKEKLISEDYENLKKIIKLEIEKNDGLLQVCFDGKLMVDLIKENHSKPVDRICVLVRANGEDHFLGAPGVVSSTGLLQFEAVKTVLEEFQLNEYIAAVCFDIYSFKHRLN